MANILKQVIKDSGKSVVKLADQLGMSQQNLNKMKSNKSEDVTIPLAIMIENNIESVMVRMEYKGELRNVYLTIKKQSYDKRKLDYKGYFWI